MALKRELLINRTVFINNEWSAGCLQLENRHNASLEQKLASGVSFGGGVDLTQGLFCLKGEWGHSGLVIGKGIRIRV